jgi:hypothetical protein
MTCDMTKSCTAPVTHIGEKGYIYCTEHAIERRRYVGEHTRKMRAWELKLIEAGKSLPSYKPLPKPKPERIWPDIEGLCPECGHPRKEEDETHYPECPRMETR